MFLARWRVDARFGHKQQVLDASTSWVREIAPKAGLEASRCQMLTGSIGALEATVEQNWRIDSLGELEQAWAKLASMEAHRKWSETLEPHIVSGTAKWEIFRVI